MSSRSDCDGRGKHQWHHRPEKRDHACSHEQLAAKAENPDIKKVILDIAKEEKTHVGEFHALLLKFDRQQVAELEAGKKEVEKETGK